MTGISLLLENFHFLRPWFLLALPAAFLWLYWFKRTSAASSNWKQAIDPNLLRHLLDNPQQQKQQRWPGYALAIAWMIACFALAGPSWEQLKQPVSKKQDALVLVLDLSLSMYAQDQKPSRIISAQRKIADILARRKEGLTALVAYAGDAHVVSPLTDDAATIATMLPALEPGIMPKYGSNLTAAFTQTRQLLDNSAIKEAQVLLLTDEISPKQFYSATKLLNSKVKLSIITFGTTTGAPIPLSQGFLKEKTGSTIIARLNWDEIVDMANGSGLKAVQSSFDDRDINQLLVEDFLESSEVESERQFDLWQDRGHWLTLLLIPLVLLSFRRGWILLPLFFILPEQSHAIEWQELWQTRNQQAATAFANGDHKTAAEKFSDPQWKASAEYRNGNYAAALEGFSQSDSPDSLYNRGNTLAKLGRFEEAIKAYDEALQKDKNLADAGANKALVEKLLKEQQNKEEQQKQEQQQEENEKSQDSEEEKKPDAAQEDSQQEENSNNASNDSRQDQQPSANDENPSENKESGDKQQDNQKTSQESKQKTDDSSADKQELKENRQAAENSTENPDEKADGQMQPQPGQTALEKEQQQALQQWLRKIPDDPGQLLRNKFRYQYEQNRRDNELLDKESETPW